MYSYSYSLSRNLYILITDPNIWSITFITHKRTFKERETKAFKLKRVTLKKRR